jgi:phosphoglycolate phosphatase-like HAD superfamily hydrolase
LGTRDRAPGGPIPRAVYVGDGLWDLRAARELGIGFVGVRHDADESRLRAEGAQRIVRDYRDPRRFIALLEEAAA